MGRPPRRRQNDTNPTRAIIARFGGVRALARLLDLPSTTVQGWFERGVIPARRQTDLLTAAARAEIGLTPQDFFTRSTTPDQARVERGLQPHVGSEVLTVAEMAEADRRTIAAGTLGIALMEAAGAAVADEVMRQFPDRPVIVLCGPGNNGGDGFVAARLLKEAGYRVRLALLGDFGALKGDAAIAAVAYKGTVEALAVDVLTGAGADGAVVIDALFGAGLTRPLEGVALATIRALNRRRLPVIAVDLPSGIHGDSGTVLGGDEGAAPSAVSTITFFRKKIGHLLVPGREISGDITVAEIGIPASVLAVIAPMAAENGPALWGKAFPWPTLSAHKYSRGHAVILGGAQMTGAARLAAQACMRVGAGLATIVCQPEVLGLYAAALPGVLTTAITHPADFLSLLDDLRKNVVLLGPGNGVTDATRSHVLFALEANRRCVLDADALTVFSDHPQDLIDALQATAKVLGSPAAVLTPHEGEFARLFKRVTLTRPDGSPAIDKLSRARAAAAATNAVVLLKGADTVIAHPDGRVRINANAPPTLATAGAGDVLAGLITGLLAQGMEPFDAASAGVWIHGAAATAFGPGLIADDLPGLVPSILREFKEVSI
jgi:ADP-dependent NAD(P)H-hydrate dehydratase / NAD(P)H-hydrate epimerase